MNDKEYISTLEWAFLAIMEDIEFKTSQPYNCPGNLIGEKEDCLSFLSRMESNIKNVKNDTVQRERFEEFKKFIYNNHSDLILPTKLIQINLAQIGIKCSVIEATNFWNLYCRDKYNSTNIDFISLDQDSIEYAIQYFSNRKKTFKIKKDKN